MDKRETEFYNKNVLNFGNYIYVLLKVDRAKILEKQCEAERRRSKSIAKRVQSARRKSLDVKVVPAKLEEER